ncbi:MAG: hypothetical protein JXR51_05010 [Bacteroidales bacterium]|nr:hypothetical protein [Bacteroidales bacterium]MBN2756519.1 hypothetical protein [Bacteroidales bacterium]
MYVKYKNDSTNYWWGIGKEFSYNKNGRLTYLAETDINKKILKYAKWYDCDGKLYKILVPDSVYDKVLPIKSIRNIFSLFTNYHIKLPNRYKEVLLNDGNKAKEAILVNFNEDGYLIDGDVIYYNKDGTIEKIVKYKKGKIVDK